MTPTLLNKIVNYSIYHDDIFLTKEEAFDLLNTYINDKNSSTLREEITLKVANVQSVDKKLSYDGFDVYGNHYEVKPANINTGQRIRRKLDGGGSYNDMTWARHYKYLEENPRVLISGFVDGLLAYIFEVPYFVFRIYMEEKLMKHLGATDTPYKYLRSFKFTFKHWKDYPDIKTVFISKIPSLLDKYYYTKEFWKFIHEAKEKIPHYPISRVVPPSLAV